MIQVRLKSSLTPSQQTRAISWIRAAVKMPSFRLGHGGRYTVTGAPVVLSDLSSTLTGSIALILLVALGVMALALLLVFRSTLRLLPLTIALMAAGITFGAIELAGGSLTLGSLAVLPILIGLAVDYAIQFQSRVQEARRDQPASATAEAVATAARVGAPAIAAAALATATGFLVLLLSPVPLMRSFGVILVVGIAVAFVCALVTCTAALVLTDRDGGVVGASLRGAGEMLGVLVPPAISVRKLLRVQAERVRAILSPRRRSAVLRSASLIATPLRRPGLVLWLALGLAVLGWVADTQTAVQSDVTKLVPSSMPALRDLHTLERTSGVSGEIDVTVRGRNVARPGVVSWMTRYEQSLLGHFGYAETTGCARATLCPALSLPDLFSAAGSTSATPLARLRSTASWQRSPLISSRP